MTDVEERCAAPVEPSTAQRAGWEGLESRHEFFKLGQEEGLYAIQACETAQQLAGTHRWLLPFTTRTLVLVKHRVLKITCANNTNELCSVDGAGEWQVSDVGHSRGPVALLWLACSLLKENLTRSPT